MTSNGNGGGFALGFLVGGIIGTVVGILIAPRPGSETRTDLAERSETWRTRAEEMAAMLRERGWTHCGERTRTSRPSRRGCARTCDSSR